MYYSYKAASLLYDMPDIVYFTLTHFEDVS